MHCKQCEYPLWNLLARHCPECGEPFRPSDYRFSLNSVAFCCPHCDQRYYGTDEQGHLEPRSFECVACRRAIDMDEMRLLPTEGVDERMTRPDVNPWHDDSIRFLRRWGATLYRGVATPGWLLRSTPVEADYASAWGFAIFTHFMIAVVAAIPVLGLMLVMGIATGGGGLGAMAGGTLLLTVGAVVVSGVVLALWTVVTHGMLRVGGATSGGMGRTAQALCFTCAPQLILVVPCLNGYFWWLGAIWWVVSAAIAVAAAQSVSGLRASVAVLVLPVTACVTIVSLAAFWFSGVIGGAATWTAQGTESVSAFAQGVRREVADGTVPAHGIEFFVDGDLGSVQYTAVFSDTMPDDVHVGGATLDALTWATGPERASLLESVGGTVYPGAPAHRVGDFVFTLDAIAHAQADGSLWVVVEAWDPAWNPTPQPEVHVLLSSGAVRSFPRGQLFSRLTRQNESRGALGLPPIPDPFTVKGEPPIP